MLYGNGCPTGRCRDLTICSCPRRITIGVPSPAPSAPIVLGWQCPSCGACYSPLVAQCWNCQPVISSSEKGNSTLIAVHLDPIAGSTHAHSYPIDEE